MAVVMMARMDPADLYLDLLKGCLTRSIFLDEQRKEIRLMGPHVVLWRAYKAVAATALRMGHGAAPVNGADWRLVEAVPPNAKKREEGRDWPGTGETMIGRARLDNLEQCVTSVLTDGVPGDLIEAGVWRGGAAILMRAILRVHDVSDRTVWLADSFEGLPAPDTDRYPQDDGPDLSSIPFLQVSVDQVKANFARYGLLDDRVKFLPGWFKDTLAEAPLDQLAVIRLDGDLYESTMDSISALYPKLSVGGYLIVDDYNAPDWQGASGQAIRDYREQHQITEPIQEVDWTGVYWRRES
jgi:O-methyltransferase